jgi:hypothetical protein
VRGLFFGNLLCRRRHLSGRYDVNGAASLGVLEAELAGCAFAGARRPEQHRRTLRLNSLAPRGDGLPPIACCALAVGLTELPVAATVAAFAGCW